MARQANQNHSNTFAKWIRPGRQVFPLDARSNMTLQPWLPSLRTIPVPLQLRQDCSGAVTAQWQRGRKRFA